MISQGDVWWAEFEGAVGSAPALRHPVVVVQCDSFNRSRIGTVVVALVTSNLRWGEAPGNVPVDAGSCGLAKDSVVNVTQLHTLDKGDLVARAGRLPAPAFELVVRGVIALLGREPD